MTIYLLWGLLFFVGFLTFRVRAALIVTLGLYSALMLILTGILAPLIWERSRVYGSPGLLPSHFLNESQIDLFHSIFFLAALGSTIASLIMFITARSARVHSYQISTIKNNFASTLDSRAIPVLGFLIVLFLYIGLGDSFLRSSVYLESTGSVTVLRAVNAMLPAVLGLLAFGSSKSRYRIPNRFLLFVLFITLLGKGSRLVILIPLFIVVVNFPKIQGVIKRIASIFLLIMLSQLLISFTFEARSGANGILNLPQIFSKVGFGFLDRQHNIESSGRMLASLTSWVPTLVDSVGTTSSRVILRNLNPLIGTGTDALAYSSDGLERLFPFTWIPLSTLGQLYGAFGGLSIVIIIGIVTLIASINMIRNSKRDGGSVFMILAIMTYIFQFPLLFQYSSRIWLRVVWLMFALTIGHIFATFMVRAKAPVRIL
jgi:hypothetical protein